MESSTSLPLPSTRFSFGGRWTVRTREASVLSNFQYSVRSALGDDSGTPTGSQKRSVSSSARFRDSTLSAITGVSTTTEEKAGFITEDERKVEEGVESVGYMRMPFCKPECSIDADIDMMVFHRSTYQNRKSELDNTQVESEEDVLRHLDVVLLNAEERENHAQTFEASEPFKPVSTVTYERISLNMLLHSLEQDPVSSNPEKSCSLSELCNNLDNAIKELEKVNASAEEVLCPLQNGQTYLHIAIIFGWTDLARRLLDCLSRSYSSSRSQCKLGQGAMCKDEHGFSPLHYVAWYGRTEVLELLLRKGDCLNLSEMMNEPAPYDRTVFHLAARNGHLATLKLLISFSAQLPENQATVLSPKDKLHLTPLHLAALHGHLQVTNLLLTNGAFSDSLDKFVRTALHIAVIRGHPDICQSIIEHTGRHLFELRDKYRRTALLSACARDNASCVTMLLSQNARLDGLTEDGSPVLFFAVNLRSFNAVRAILKSNRWEEAFAVTASISDKSRKFEAHITTLFAEEPDIFELMLDRFVTEDGGYRRATVLGAQHMTWSNSLKRHYHFRYLYHDFTNEMTNRQAIEDSVFHEVSSAEKSNCLVQTILDHNNLHHLLLKPIVVEWMRKKWIHFTRLFVTVNFLLYCLFLVFLTVSVTTVEPFQRCPYFIDVNNLKKYQRNDLATASSVFVIIFSICSLMKECFEVYNKGVSYLYDASNYIEWPMFIMAIVFAGAGQGTPSKNIWIVGMLSVSLCWTNLLLFLRRFTFFGIYITMFLQVLKTFFHALVVYGLFILGFGFAFRILLSEMKDFSSLGRALATTLTMATDGIVFPDFFTVKAKQKLISGSCNDTVKAVVATDASGPDLELLYSGWTSIYLVMFIFIGPIILTNLLTGLAVDDISKIRKKASVEIAKNQARLILDSERRTAAFAKRFPFLKKIVPRYYNEPAAWHFVKHRGARSRKPQHQLKDFWLIKIFREIFDFNLDPEEPAVVQQGGSERFNSNKGEMSMKDLAAVIDHQNAELERLSSSQIQLVKTIAQMNLSLTEELQLRHRV